jgi:zinc transport system ATP-binding protein
METKQAKAKQAENCSGLCCTKIEHFEVVIGKSIILEDVNLHVHCRELTAVIGPNGAGKTTLLKAILGELKHKGTLSFLDEKGLRTGAPLMGYVPQSISFDWTTPASVLDFMVASRTNIPTWVTIPKAIRENVLDNLQKVNCGHIINRRLGTLSGGELQRVLLALALDPIPDILLLDEPVSGIDQSGLEIFYNTVSEIREKYDLSIILVSHDLDLVAKYADRIIVLNKKIISSGTPRQVFNDPEVIKIFGMEWYKNFADSNDICISEGGKADA